MGRNFINCVVYLSFCGILSNIIGEMLPRSKFKSEKQPYTLRDWEKDGDFYERFNIRHWKDKIPDLSKIKRKMMPKKLKGKKDRSSIERLIQETCVAERVHRVLISAGFGCLILFPGKGGIFITIIWSLGQIPYIIIQRYNRPRLKRVIKRLDSSTRSVDSVKSGSSISLTYEKNSQNRELMK